MTNEESYAPEAKTIGDYMIMFKTVSSVERRCFKITARCWESNKWLFLRKATIVKCTVEGPGRDHNETFYFDPKFYTLFLMQQ